MVGDTIDTTNFGQHWKPRGYDRIQELRRAMLLIHRKLGSLKAVPSSNEQLWTECNGAWHGPKNLPKYIYSLFIHIHNVMNIEAIFVLHKSTALAN